MRTATTLTSAVLAAAVLFGFSGLASAAHAAEMAPSNGIAATRDIITATTSEAMNPGIVAAPTPSAGDDEMAAQGTRQFTITNMSGHTLTIKDIWGTTGWPQPKKTGFDIDDEFPRAGSVLKPGQRATLEIRDWSDHGITVKFLSDNGQEGHVYLHVSGLSRYSDAQGLSKEFIKGGSDVVIMDKPGTEVTIGNGDPAAQTDALNSLCSQAAVNCAFTPTGFDDDVLGPMHPYGAMAQNATPWTNTYTVGGDDIVTRSQTLEIEAGIKANILNAVEISLTTKWGETRTASHVFHSSIQQSIPSGWVAWTEAQEPLIRDTGDFTITMKGSNASWTLKDVSFDHPRVGGQGVYTMIAREMTEAELQKARDRGGVVTKPWQDSSMPRIAVPFGVGAGPIDIAGMIDAG